MRVQYLQLALCFFVVTNVSAQSLTVQKTEISSYAAKEIVAACIALAESEKWSVTIAVVDPHGNLLVFEAMQGTLERSILTAQLKAKTAARWGTSTDNLFERVNNHINRAPEWAGDFPQPGGYPIIVNGTMIGAAGGSGSDGRGDNSVDEKCVLHGIRTVFGKDVGVE